MRPSRRSAWRPARSGCGRSTRSVARSSRDAGIATDPLADRAVDPRVRGARGPTNRPGCGSTRSSRGSRSSCGVTAAEVAADPEAGPTARAFVAYERAVAATGGLDFDDLILRSIAAPRTRPGPARPVARPLPGAAGRRGPGRRSRAARTWRCSWPRRRTGSSWSAMTTSRSTAGGSPTSGGSSPSTTACPGLRRVDLEVNYRCPASGRGARGPARRAQPASGSPSGSASGPAAEGRLILAPGPVGRDRAPRPVPFGPGRTTAATRAILARTNRELLPAVAVAIELRHPLPGAPDRSADRVGSGGRRLLDTAADRAATRRAGPGLHRPGPGVGHAIPATRRSPRRLARLGGAHRAWRRAVRDLARSAPRSRRPARRLAELRRDDAAADPRHGPRDEGPRVRPRRRHRDGGRPIPERAVRRGRGGPGRAPTRRNAAWPTSRGPGRAGR